MNIRNDLQSIQPVSGVASVSAVGNASRASASSPPVAAGGDRADLSAAASLSSHAASLPDVRAEKVQSIQDAIAAGNYSVSSTDVAQSLMGHMLGSQQ